MLNDRVSTSTSHERIRHVSAKVLNVLQCLLDVELSKLQVDRLGERFRFGKHFLIINHFQRSADWLLRFELQSVSKLLIGSLQLLHSFTEFVDRVVTIDNHFLRSILLLSNLLFQLNKY